MNPADGVPEASPTSAVRAGLTVAALGVVFGDIGTSPLYTMQAVFATDASRPVAVDEVATYGVASLITWAVVLVVLVKYVGLIMRADNDGEGGIMALVSLLTREHTTGRPPRRLIALGVAGAALFFGDSLITPAISVLSAVEGLELVDPALGTYVVPAAVVILVLLFAIQRAGTGMVGRWFGPIMLAWFLVIGGFGLASVLQDPEILRALSPTYGLEFLRTDRLTAFLSLGAVVLAVTGAEALYADLGHFGAPPIRRAWLRAVFPALILSYLGQAALILRDPAQAGNPFFGLVPDAVLLPVVLLATVATVIASQAVISGAFSLARQASRLGYLPALDIRHTSATDTGQVYVPLVNALLLAGVLLLVLAFGSSARLASAYGIAVTGTMSLTAILFFSRALRRGRHPRALVLAVAAAILGVDLAFLAANVDKIPRGGWLPLVVAGVTFTVMTEWRSGTARIHGFRGRREGQVIDYVQQVAGLGLSLRRLPGTAVYLAAPGDRTAPALRAAVERIGALHEQVLIVTVVVHDVPRITGDARAETDTLGLAGDGIARVRLHFGYFDDQDVPRALAEALATAPPEGPVDLDDATYFVSETDLRPGRARGLSRLRERLFLTTARLAAHPVRRFGLPPDRTLTIGQSMTLP